MLFIFLQGIDTLEFLSLVNVTSMQKVLLGHLFCQIGF